MAESEEPSPGSGCANPGTWPDQRLLAECRWEAFRGPGPGGQKRNKTSSAVRVTHEPTGLSAVAGESRSQARNRDVALQRLRHRLVLERREILVIDDGFVVPRWFGQLTAGGRLAVPLRSDDYLRTVALVLDVLDGVGWSVSDAARVLGLTTGNLVAFLQADDKLWAHVNRRRNEVGLRTLN